MSDEGRFVLAREGQFVVVASPDPQAQGTWLCELWTVGGPVTHHPPYRKGKDWTWALARKRLSSAPAPDQRTGESSYCRAVRIMRELCPYLRDPKRGESVRSFQWNGRLRTLGRPRPEGTREDGDGGESAAVDVEPGGLAALKSENQV